jgi:hypothetical protein
MHIIKIVVAIVHILMRASENLSFSGDTIVESEWYVSIIAKDGILA